MKSFLREASIVDFWNTGNFISFQKKKKKKNNNFFLGERRDGGKYGQNDETRYKKAICNYFEASVCSLVTALVLMYTLFCRTFLSLVLVTYR